jgi:outer membrane protein
MSKYLRSGVYLLSLFVGTAFAQSQAVQYASTSEKMSLQQCVDLAWKNNIQVKQTNLSVEQGINSLNLAKWSRLPNLNGNVGQGLSFGRGIDPFTNTFINRNITFNNIGLNAGITVFNGYQIQNTIKQNQLSLEASQQDLQAIKDQVALNVALGYLGVLNNEDLLTIARNQVEITRLQQQRTEKLVQAGSLPEANLFDIKAQLANDELAVVNGEISLDAAKLNLLQILNINGRQDIQLDRLGVLPPATDIYPETVEQIYETAVKIQANVKAADLRVQSAERGIDVAKGGLFPTVSLSGNYSTNYSSAAQRSVYKGVTTQALNGTVSFQGQSVPITFNVEQPSFGAEKISYLDQLNTNQNKGVNLNVRVPIFNGYQAKTRIANSILNKRNQEYQSENVRLQLRQNIETAYNNMRGAAKRFASTQQQVEALERAFRVADSRFNAGAINSVDYNLAKTNLDRAKANLVQAKYDFIFRTKILDYLQGKPLSF